MTKKDVKIAIFSAFAGIIFTAIYDLIKSKPVLSTFWNLLKWIWNNLFEFQITIWQLLLGIITLIFILYLFSKSDSGISANQSDWRSYVKDNIHNMDWSWYWEKNILDGKWNIKDLRPVCNSCETKMRYSSYNRIFAECPRCEKKYFENKDIYKVEDVIIDNVQRGIYPKDIK